MVAPLTGYGSLIALAGIVLGWTGSALSARADHLVSHWGSFGRTGPSSNVLDRHGKRSRQSLTYQSRSSTGLKRRNEEEEEEDVVSERDRVLLLELLASSVMMLAPDTGSYDRPPPLIVKPPVKPRPPHAQHPPPSHTTPEHTPQQSPEPASLVTGLLGSGLLGLMGWRRRRKRKHAEQQEPQPDVG